MAISDAETARAIANIAGASAAAHVTLAHAVAIHIGVEWSQFLDTLIDLHSRQSQAASDPLTEEYFDQVLEGLRRIRPTAP
jgi:hypothetical protein